jgi:hypothetical protein
MSKHRPDTPISKLSTLINQMLQFKSMMQSQSNCKIRQRHLCQSLVDRLLRLALPWLRSAALIMHSASTSLHWVHWLDCQKLLTDGVLNDDFDGDQIYTILSEVLFNSWQEVPAALTWATYDPTTQWQDAENTGLGEIDRPGNYELENRSSERPMFIHWYQLWQHPGLVTFTKMHKVKFLMQTAHTEPIIWRPMGMLNLQPTTLWHRV